MAIIGKKYQFLAEADLENTDKISYLKMLTTVKIWPNKKREEIFRKIEEFFPHYQNFSRKIGNEIFGKKEMTTFENLTTDLTVEEYCSNIKYNQTANGLLGK